MEASDAIAALSAVLAAASALYARHAVVVAQKSNEIAKHSNNIAKHDERLKLYRALLSYHAHLAARGVSVTEQQLWSFHETAQLAEFYYGKEHADVFQTIFDDSLRLFSLRDTWESEKEEKPGEQYKELVRETHQLHRATRDKCSALADALKPILRIGGP